MDYIAFENAMFGGIDTILAYYEPYISVIARQNEDRSRATLGHHDIAQECRRVIYRCWKKQSLSSCVKNFDILVKVSITRAVLSMRGKEYAPKRGRFHIPFFSEIVQTQSGESRDLDSVLGAAEERPSYETIISNFARHLPDPELERTFRHIAENEQPEHLNAQELPTSVRVRIATSLGITEQKLNTQLEDITFILRGFRSVLCGS